jgi:phosphoglycerol geranylgeranyltransferase
LKIKNYIKNKIKELGTLHMTLLDPDDIHIEDIPTISNFLSRSGTDAIMIGGSTVSDQEHLKNVVISIKNHIHIPVILFPNNVTGITKYADAIWFMSLFNSTNPYFITGAQMLAAPYIFKANLEPLSMAYLIIGEGKAAGFMGQAIPIPADKPEIAAGYALAAEMFGFDFVYLEAGSGARAPLSPKFVSVVKKVLNRSSLIVGGGIRKPEEAYTISKAGADIIVTGTIFEEEPRKIEEIINEIRRGGKEKRNESGCS